MSKVSVDLIHSMVDIVGSLVTTAAVLVGGWWFFVRRAGVRKANIEHEVTFAAVGHEFYMNVKVRIKNGGNRQIIIDGEKVRKGANWGNVVLVEEVVPYLESNDAELLPKSAEFQMLSLGARAFPGKLVIEPGEEQAIVFDFMVPKTSHVVRVYSYVDNVYNNDSGWNTVTIHKVEAI